MNKRNKPFPYDAVETQDAIMVIFPSQSGTPAPAQKTITKAGLQIDRPDGMIVRIANLHPRLRTMLDAKPTYAIEVTDADAVLYSVGHVSNGQRSISELLPEQFYWYIGPETSTIQQVSTRPLAHLISRILHRPVSVVPGQAIGGPCIGLCRSPTRFLPLTKGRKWAQATKGIIIDAGLAAGTVTGYPANDDVPASVNAAHIDFSAPPEYRPRSAWSSQIGMAFYPEDKPSAGAG